MTRPAAIQAQLVDVRNIAAHRCVRLEIHVPVEQASMVMQAFGWPTSADPVPVAIARLDLAKAEPTPRAAPARTAWQEKSPAQQAGIRCNEPLFARFMEEQIGTPLSIPEGVADAIRSHCGIASRRDFATNPEALVKWRALDDAFWFWQRDQAS